jgi:hypothetical protein
MADVLMVLTILVFFLACVAYVGWCGRIIGPDPDETDVAATAAADAAAADELAVAR